MFTSNMFRVFYPVHTFKWTEGLHSMYGTVCIYSYIRLDIHEWWFHLSFFLQNFWQNLSFLKYIKISIAYFAVINLFSPFMLFFIKDILINLKIFSNLQQKLPFLSIKTTAIFPCIPLECEKREKRSWIFSLRFITNRHT